MTLSIESTPRVGVTGFQGYKKNIKNENVNFTSRDDLFEKPNKKVDKSSNGKFDISECVKNFAKGLLSPITAVIKHPLMTIGTLAATVALCSVVPVMAPILAVGFGALSVYQVGKGVVEAAKNYNNGEYDKAEKSFNKVGEGTIGVVLTALGIKQSARVAKEAKVMSELGVTSLDKAQKLQIANDIKNGTKLSALKEITTLFTSKTGLKAVGAQFKPSNIAARAKDVFKFLFTREDVTKIKKEKMKFTETTEGKRRAVMSSQEIEAEVKSLYKEAFDEYGIPEELRPEIKIIKENMKKGGGYASSMHEIRINENSYREGVFDLPDVIKHEATHAQKAILRQRLPQEEKEKLLVEYLLNKIKNGEKENVLNGEANILTGCSTMKAPKMSVKMRDDFAKLAQEKLYKMKSYTTDELSQMVKPIVENNPDFVQMYKTPEEAINVMTNYARGHNARYQIAVKNSFGFDTSKIDTKLLKELSAEERKIAIQSLKDGIDCIESNASNSTGALGFGGDINQYQFSAEEVLCQQKGNNFEISKLEAQLAKLRSQKNYDVAEEARLMDLIKRSKLIIEYKTKGQEMYKLYTESLNHPENKQLAKQVQFMKDELYQLQREISSISGVYAEDLLGLNVHVKTNQYSVYKAKVRPELGSTRNIPLTTTVAGDIIAE